MARVPPEPRPRPQRRAHPAKSAERRPARRVARPPTGRGQGAARRPRRRARGTRSPGPGARTRGRGEGAAPGALVPAAGGPGSPRGGRGSRPPPRTRARWPAARVGCQRVAGAGGPARAGPKGPSVAGPEGPRGRTVVGGLGLPGPGSRGGPVRDPRAREVTGPGPRGLGGARRARGGRSKETSALRRQARSGRGRGSGWDRGLVGEGAGDGWVPEASRWQRCRRPARPVRTASAPGTAGPRRRREVPCRARGDRGTGS